jgi:hypothetical protein
MLKRDFSFRINKIKQLLGGLKARTEEAAAWGYSAEFIVSLSTIHDELTRLQDVRNTNITEGKAATAKQQQLLLEAEKQATMVRQSIRSRLPESDWNQFGFYPGETSTAKSTAPQTNSPGQVSPAS